MIFGNRNDADSGLFNSGLNQRHIVSGRAEERVVKLTYLPTVELFRDLTEEEIAELQHVIEMKRFKAGEIFFTPGQRGDVLFILKEGTVQIHRRSPKGRKLVLAQLRPYAFFGEMSCIGQGMYYSFAEATEDSVIGMIRRADLQQVLLAKPAVALRILEAVGRRAIEAEERLEESLFKGIVARLAAFLLRESTGGQPVKLSHNDIAERLGVYRETVTCALDQLRTLGVLETQRRRINLTDRDALKHLASAE